jgi:hypothetical protein
MRRCRIALAYLLAGCCIVLCASPGLKAQGREGQSFREQSMRLDARQKVISITNENLRFGVSYEKRCLIDSL